MKKLAINGGKPVSNIKLKKPSPIEEEEVSILKEVMRNGILSAAGQGKYVNMFEREFAKFHNVGFALSTTSGTTALHTALCALGVGMHDEVLVPSLTFVSSAAAILYCNAIPVFVDIDPKSFCIDPIDLRNKITKKSKVIIVVHLYGRPAEMNEIMDIARSYDLKIAEDCAQSHGAQYRNNVVGSFSDLSCFSFYQTKNMTCGEGGMILTKKHSLYQKCSIIKDHGLPRKRRESYNYERLGFNYHLTELQAGIGLVQLRKLKDMNDQRKKNATLYKKILGGTDLTFQDDPPYVEHVYYSLTGILPERLKKKRDWFVKAVRKENVEINKIYPIPLHKTKLFERITPNAKCPISEGIAERLINLYTNPGISNSYIDLTCKAIKKVLLSIEE